MPRFESEISPVTSLTLDHFPHLRISAKLEFFNPTGSVKDRSASYVLGRLLENKTIDQNTTIVESSSGNFGVALAAECFNRGLKFICVVDPNLSKANELLMTFYQGQIIRVNEPDIHGGFLINRLMSVKHLRETITNSYWINQYANPLNAEAYDKTIGQELCNQFDHLDYIFIGVSSGGTITGVSHAAKRKFPHIKIIAVDVEGSVIFKGSPSKRVIPGIGSSIVPQILEYAMIDEVVIVSELESVDCCHQLARKHSIFAGGSSGSVFCGFKKYFSDRSTVSANVLLIFPDSGWKYLDTVYCDSWVEKLREIHNLRPTTSNTTPMGNT